MSDAIDMAAKLLELRAQFKPEEIGKLPRVNCNDCRNSKIGQCGNHSKKKCDGCKSYMTTAHIHIDFVGHADVTARLLSVDPLWGWDPQATDPDPELLRAAMATGNAAIVEQVVANAPPKFERTATGTPVGLWIWLTVCGKKRAGYGTVPTNQFEPEKVLIGDALRNAAMRFGVALDQWAKGDREDPTAENSAGADGHAERHVPSPEQGRRGKVTRAEQPKEATPKEATPADAAAGDTDWGVALAGIVTDEDADRVEGEIKAAHDAGRLKPVTANALRKAIAAKRGKLASSDKAATG